MTFHVLNSKVHDNRPWTSKQSAKKKKSLWGESKKTRKWMRKQQKSEVGLTLQEGVHLFKWKGRELSGHQNLQKGP